MSVACELLKRIDGAPARPSTRQFSGPLAVWMWKLSPRGQSERKVMMFLSSSASVRRVQVEHCCTVLFQHADRLMKHGCTKWTFERHKQPQIVTSVLVFDKAANVNDIRSCAQPFPR